MSEGNVYCCIDCGTVISKPFYFTWDLLTWTFDYLHEIPLGRIFWVHDVDLGRPWGRFLVGETGSLSPLELSLTMTNYYLTSYESSNFSVTSECYSYLLRGFEGRQGSRQRTIPMVVTEILI